MSTSRFGQLAPLLPLWQKAATHTDRRNPPMAEGLMAGKRGLIMSNT